MKRYDPGSWSGFTVPMDPLGQARALYAAGRLREAGTQLSEILRREPSNAAAMQLLGAIQFQTGYQREGVKLAERAVSLDPWNADAWNTLGLMRHMHGNGVGAVEAFTKATEVAPRFFEAWKNLGFALQSENRHGEALDALQRAGATADVYFFRGNSLAALEQHRQAIAQFDLALRTDPENADVWHNRGNSLVALGEAKEGVESIKRALKGYGRAAGPHCSLAAALLASGRADEALAIIDLVLKWEPGLERALELRETIVTALGALEEAATRLQGQEDAGSIEPRRQLAKALQAQGKWKEAVGSLADANDPGLRFLEALLMPVIFESQEIAHEALGQLRTRVQRLREDRLHLDDPLRQVGVTAFHLPYFGTSERPYQEAIAQLYLESAPSLRFEAAHSPGTGRIRIGILCAYLTDHTISRVFGGLFERLDSETFELVYLQIGPSDAVSGRFAARSDRHVLLESDLATAREQVANEKLDMLFYPEIGMDPLTYYLAFSRLAPVQLTTWGHPLTTGSPAMDCFISSMHLEREDGQEEYTEKLLQPPSLGTFYTRPARPPAWSRAEFGLPDDRRLYGCPQMPYKFHPSFDGGLANLMERDERGSIVLVEPQRPYFKQVLLERWSKTHPILLDRVIWLHLMPFDRFLRLMQLCDALLAPIQFGAGRSTLDAFGVGVPVVTFKGPYLKSRITYAAYQESGLLDLVAETEEQYIELALRLASDRNWQTEMRRAVTAKSQPLFENHTAVRELNDLLLKAANRA